MTEVTARDARIIVDGKEFYGETAEHRMWKWLWLRKRTMLVIRWKDAA